MVKDITSTTFGLLIAYLIPGVFGLYSLGFWIEDIDKIFDAFISAKTDVGLFFLFIFLSIAVGLIVTIIKWFLYEKLNTRQTLPNDLFASVGTSDTKLIAFRAAVDEHYRYHQFWGNLSIILPILSVSSFLRASSVKLCIDFILILLVLILIEILLIAAAIEAFKYYVSRSISIMNK